MHLRSLSHRLALTALLLPASACFRYITVTRPATEADCPPPHTPHARFAARPDSTAPGTIHGVVWSAAAPGPAEPLRNALVQINTGRAHVLTDSLGRFRIDALRPATYELITRSIGYFARRDTVHVSERSGAEVVVHLERTPLDGCPGYMALAERKRQWYWPW